MQKNGGVKSLLLEEKVAAKLTDEVENVTVPPIGN